MSYTKKRKVGSGRLKGSFSFSKITLAELNEKFKDPNTAIPCYRKWAESLDFNIKTIPAKEMRKRISSTPNSELIIKLHHIE